MIPYFYLYWVDANINNEENQTYIKMFEKFGFMAVVQFDNLQDLMDKLDQRGNQHKIILLSYLKVL